jgi:mannose-6-phosphate isomerase-like protein (cupin superfamily)
MSRVSTAELDDRLKQEDEYYLEVLSEDSLSVELARYPNPEPKTPYKSDELYFVISGSGMARVGNERFAVDPGDVVYAARGVEHDFFDIDDEITALIVFTDTRESVLGRNL